MFFSVIIITSKVCLILLIFASLSPSTDSAVFLKKKMISYHIVKEKKTYTTGLSR